MLHHPSVAVGVICAAYGVAVWVVQMYRVAPPRDWLLERIQWLRAQISADKLPSGGLDTAALAVLDEVEKSVDKTWLFLRVPKVQCGWRFVHGVEDRRLLNLSDSALLTERLKTSRARLALVRGAVAGSFTTRLQDVSRMTDDAKRALLYEAESYRHEESTARYEDLANLLGKAVWLTWVALGAVVALATLFGHESYFLFGAAGGLMSRLTRVLRRKPSASDYGAEWSTLILSPVFGALAGWLGVAVAVTLASEPFNVLGTLFASLWSNTGALLGLTLALALGFSERLFERLLGVAEKQIATGMPSEPEDDTQPPSGSVTDAERSKSGQSP